MAFYAFTSADSGAPTLNGVNGSWINVLDWIVVTKGGGTKVYSGTNKAIYQLAGGGMYLRIVHDSAVSSAANLATVRSCEGATGVDTYTDPCPTVAQRADTVSVWAASSTANSTARTYRGVITDNILIIVVQYASTEAAVLYTYPLYEMARMRAATSPRRTESGDEAPAPQRWCNTFVHARQLLRAGGSRVVTPNHDTLYTNAWLDLSAGPLVIDVRSLREFEALALEDALHLPLSDLERGIGAVAPDRATPLVLYCASGGRSGMGCMLLRQLGYTQVSNAGGLYAAAATLQRRLIP